MASNYQRGKNAEIKAAEWLRAKYGMNFAKKTLRLGSKSNGTPLLHSFDLVSDDNQIVVEVKSHQMTKSGNTPSGKVSDTYQACSMLERVNVGKKLLILTDPDFYDLFKRCSDGKISTEIKLVLLNDDKKARKFETLPETPINCKVQSSKHDDFCNFWSGLAFWLSTKQTIVNWTVDKGPTGEDFEAGPIIGDYTLVYPQSALGRQRVPKKDFELVYDNWSDYCEGKVGRGELARKSRFTKYTISILHQYLASKRHARR